MEPEASNSRDAGNLMVVSPAIAITGGSFSGFTITVTVVSATLPLSSMTLRVMTYSPSASKVWLRTASVPITASPIDHSKVSGSPSGSVEPEASNSRDAGNLIVIPPAITTAGGSFAFSVTATVTVSSATLSWSSMTLSVMTYSPATSKV